MTGQGGESTELPLEYGYITGYGITGPSTLRCNMFDMPPSTSVRPPNRNPPHSPPYSPHPPTHPEPLTPDPSVVGAARFPCDSGGLRTSALVAQAFGRSHPLPLGHIPPATPQTRPALLLGHILGEEHRRWVQPEVAERCDQLLWRVELPARAQGQPRVRACYAEGAPLGLSTARHVGRDTARRGACVGSC